MVFTVEEKCPISCPLMKLPTSSPNPSGVASIAAAVTGSVACIFFASKNMVPLSLNQIKVVKDDFTHFSPQPWHQIMKPGFLLEDRKHTSITYMPNDVKMGDFSKKYPVVFSAHGGGGTLFEAENHGFVAICHEKGIIVVAPENENSNGQVSANNLKPTLDKMEEMGYPIDCSRVYYTGISAGGAL